MSTSSLLGEGDRGKTGGSGEGLDGPASGWMSNEGEVICCDITGSCRAI